MLIWHIEFNSKSWTEDRLNDSAAHQRVDIIEAGTLRVNTTANGRYTTNLKDDTFPGSQNVTEYGTIYAWDNRKAVNAIYSIIEKDSLVCFIAREVKVGNIPFYIRRAKVAVTKENRNVLQLLDLLKDVEEYTDYCCEEEAPDIIRRHILRNKILRSDVDKYIGNFPLKTYKYIYDLRLYDVFA